MLVTISVMTVLIVVFNMCAILFMSNTAEFRAIKVGNMAKTLFFILRESLYFLSLTVVCVVMRQRLQLPEFFGNEL